MAASNGSKINNFYGRSVNTYRLQFQCLCPSNHQTVDNYSAKIESDTMIAVENILQYIERVTARPQFQEALTQQLADVLMCAVELTGVHQGVEITSSATPSKDPSTEEWIDVCRSVRYD